MTEKLPKAPRNGDAKQALRFIISIVLSVMFALFLTGCTVRIGNTGLAVVQGRGEMVSRDFTPGDFNAIDISGGYDVSFTYAQGAALRVNMQENLFDYLEVAVRNGTLYVSSTRGFNTTSANQPTIHIYAPSITALSFAGAVNTVNWDTVRGESFTLDVAGAANITLDLDVEVLEISAAGAANINLAGRADTTEISTAGASDLSALELDTRDTTVSIAGTGNVDIAVSESLNASIAGAGRIRYLGDPAVSQSVAGVGRISRY